MENENGVSCRGYAVGHIASPYGDMLEFELFGEEQTWCLVMVPDFRGRGGPRLILRRRRLAGSGGHPSSIVMALRKYLSGGRIRDIGNTRHGAFFSVEMATLSGEAESGDVCCRFDRHGVSMVLPGGRWILGRDKTDSAGGPDSPELADRAENSGPELGEEPRPDEKTLEAWFFECRAKILRNLDGRIKKQRALIANIERDLEEFARHEEVQRQGELLKSQLFKIRRGMAEVELEDWFSQSEDGATPLVRVSLDPVKEPSANCEAYFARAARYRRGLVSAARRLDEVRAALGPMEIERATCAGIACPDFKGLAGYAAGSGRGRESAGSGKAPASQKRALPWRSFVKKDVVILAGKNAASNAQLSLKIASGNDLWFHAKNWPGSHVILRRKHKSHVFTEDEIHTAAVIALYYSEAKRFGREEVMLTEAKHVKRIPGAPVGAVSAAASRSLLVTLDDEVVRSALASEEKNAP